jgi:thioredoxin-like negative regulator of GroEL
MGHLAELTHGRRDTAHVDAHDLLAVSRLYIERQDAWQAECLLTSVVQSCEAAARMEARKMLSLLHKRAGRWEDAVGLWQQMIRDQPGDLFALIELAKWYEHRAHDYAAALKLVGLALRQTDERAAMAEREALLRRRQRLQRRHAEHAPKK